MNKNYMRIQTITAIVTLVTFVSTFIPPLSFADDASASSLSVDVFAEPSSGTAPLNDVDLTAIVSGDGTGTITYKFDCTANGTWEKTIVTSSTSHTAVDLCDYTQPGSFTAKVRVERENLAFEGTTAILVTAGQLLQVDLSANPTSGFAPLNGVDVTAKVSGSAAGAITYKFDCTSDGTIEKIVTTSNTTHTAVDLCNYPDPGVFTISVTVEQGQISATGEIGILVKEPQTLFVELEADPSSGQKPLNDVDLIATVSGTATGTITYKFDCTSNGTIERTVTTSNTTHTALDVCDYPSAGLFTAKVQVTRGSLTAQDTTQIDVVEIKTMQLSITAIPSSGHAPLENVDVRAEVSGTASGSIEFKFDCTDDGVWDHEFTTNDTVHVATNICNYPDPGVFTLRVSAEREGLTIQGTGEVVVGETANLALEFMADPSFGEGQLLDVDLIAFVSGSADGPITYKFDCRNDGTFEKTVTTNDNSQTAVDLCDYTSPGVFTAKVRIERGGITIIGTTVILVAQQSQ